MADYLTTDTELTSIANAIRTKAGMSESESLVYPAGFVTAIQNIPRGGTYQVKTNVDPLTSSQTIRPDSGYDALTSVQINAMPSGTAGTPTATKGAVSNHSVSVTPSVTNITGYITGGTNTGTAVTVSADELVSDTRTITTSDDAQTDIDVTNEANVKITGINVPINKTLTVTSANNNGTMDSSACISVTNKINRYCSVTNRGKVRVVTHYEEIGSQYFPKGEIIVSAYKQSSFVEHEPRISYTATLVQNGVWQELTNPPIPGVVLTAPSSGTQNFYITVPNGNSTATFMFNVDTSGNVTITES